MSKWTTLVGQMRFNIANVITLVLYGIWENVILHEMGHVIGIGTLWYLNGLVDRTNLEYHGSNAIDVWRNDWGCSALEAPPVEEDGQPGDGIHGGHWDEHYLRNEFMTGMANVSSNPILMLTVASIEYLGYEVDYNATNAYNGTNTNCCHGGTGVHSPWLRRSLYSNPSARLLRSNCSNRLMSAIERVVAIAHGREVLHKRRKKQPGSSMNGYNYGGWLEAKMVTETMFLTTEGASIGGAHGDRRL